MRIGKNDFTGLGKVFRFTLTAHLKSRANRVSLLLMLLLAVVGVPVCAIVTGGRALEAETAAVSTVYLQNSTAFPLDIDALCADPYFAATRFVQSAADERLEPDAESIVASIDAQEGCFLISLHLADGCDWESALLTRLQNALTQVFDEARLRVLGADAQQIAVASSPYSAEVVTESTLRNADKVPTDTRFAVQYIYSILVMTISVMTASYIVRAIVEEKASKLVELLMVSVRPLALIVGKILATMVYVFGMFALMALAFALSFAVTGRFLDVSGLTRTLASFGLNAQALNISPMTVLIVLVSLLLGYLTFSIFSGIGGACCSTMEDVDAAQLSSVLVIMTGYLVSCFAAAFSHGAAPVVFSLIPVVNIFCAPTAYVCGGIGPAVLCLSWIEQALVVAALAFFCARVYNELLIYRGARVKLRQLFAMARRPEKEGA